MGRMKTQQLLNMFPRLYDEIRQGLLRPSGSNYNPYGTNNMLPNQQGSYINGQGQYIQPQQGTQYVTPQGQVVVPQQGQVVVPQGGQVVVPAGK